MLRRFTRGLEGSVLGRTALVAGLLFFQQHQDKVAYAIICHFVICLIVIDLGQS